MAATALVVDKRFELAARVRHAARQLDRGHPARQPLLDRALLLEVPGPDAPLDEITNEIARLLGGR